MDLSTPAIDFADLSPPTDAAIAVLFARAAGSVCRFELMRCTWVVKVRAGWVRLEAPRQRPLGTLANFVFELRRMLREAGHEDAAAALSAWLSAERLDAVLRVAEAPAADMREARGSIYCMSIEEVDPI